MGEWTSDSRTHVAHMSDGDFIPVNGRVMDSAQSVSIVFRPTQGAPQVLKSDVSLLEAKSLMRQS